MQTPRPGPHTNAAVVVTIALCSAVALVLAGTFAYLLVGVSNGRHSTISRPCELLDSSALTSLQLGSSPPADPQSTGSFAACTWNSLDTGGRVEAELTCVSRGLTTSAEQKAHTQFHLDTHGDTAKYLSVTPIGGVGDEAAMIGGHFLLQVRTGNVVWTFDYLGYTPSNRAFMGAARHIDAALRSDRSL